MATGHNNNAARFIDHVSERTSARCVLTTNNNSDFADQSDFSAALGIESSTGCIQFVARQMLARASADDLPACLELSDGRTLIAANATQISGRGSCLVAVIEGPPPLAQRLIQCAVESYELTLDVGKCHTALEESAMQLAQSFEEQNWLRGFARNASAFTKSTSANDMAIGILKPLGYLLRAQDVYLIVEPQETERSGLQSAKFGESDFSVATIAEILAEQGVYTADQPFVRNDLSISTQDGLIQSLVAVTVPGEKSPVAQLVGINRCSEVHADGLPIYDPEFGSGEVGLLEEAAVLLSTQAQNIHLLVSSNQLFLGSLHAMSSAIDARDPYTQGHSERVARLAFDLAKIMNLSDAACQEIYLAGILHDIGKIGIPDSVLLKNGPLSDDEFRVIQQHPEIGYRIVQRLGQLQFVLPGILHHHERWDGLGYPHGLAGKSIPLMGRVLAVADAFDAMTSSRPYRSAMPLSKACSIIRAGGDQQWDGEVVNCFDTWIETRTAELGTQPVSAEGLIPEESPVEYIVQAVMALGL